MLHRLDPMDLSLDFDDRAYKLGEMVAVRVEIVPKGRITIREAGVELLCDQKFAETYTVSGPGLYSNPGVASPRPQIPNQVGSERLESYVHSRTAFLSDVTPEPGEPRSFDVRLPIDTALPRRFDDAKALEGDAVRSWSFDWRLVVAVDVAGGRDARLERAVKVQVA